MEVPFGIRLEDEVVVAAQPLNGIKDDVAGLICVNV